MSALRKSAKGEVCTLQLPGVCLHLHGQDPQRETTVLAHLRDHTGLALKPSDSQAIYACHACHDVLDGRMKGHIRAEIISAALVRTHTRMLFKGLRP